MAQELHPVAREKLESGHFTDVTPVLSVGGKREDGVVVTHVLAACDTRSCGENFVIYCEAFFYELPTAYHHQFVHTKLE